MILPYKKSIFLSLVICFAVQTVQIMGSNHEYSINSISSKNIEAARQKVIIDVRNHKLYQIATVSGTLAVAGLAGYWFFFRETPVAASQTAKNGCLGLSDAQRELFTDLMLEKQHKAGIFFTGKTWYSAAAKWLTQQLYLQGYQVAVGVGASVVFNVLNNGLGPISKYINRFDGFLDRTVSGLTHKINLEWFISKNGNLVQIFNMLELYVATLEGRALQIQSNLLIHTPVTVPAVAQGAPVSTQTLSMRNASMKDIADCWNLYIQQIEMILGFIHYSIKIRMHTNELESQRMITIKEKIELLTNDFATVLQQRLHNVSDATSILIYDDLRTLRALVGQELSNFSVLESFKRHDFVAEKEL